MTEAAMPETVGAAERDLVNVSVVIVNWNTRDILAGCLNSIYQETKARLQVVVVDNASADGSADMVAERFPQVELIRNSDNLGFAAANNQGIRVARGRYVLFLNPDTRVIDGAIDTMLEWIEGKDDVGCVGCQVLEDEATIQHTCFSEPGPLAIAVSETGLDRAFPRFFGWTAYIGWDRTDERDVDVVSGMFMLIPKPVLDRVGEMDDNFFVYSEEADLCRRIRMAGYRCVFAPVARILHLDGGSKSTAQIRSRMWVQLQKSKTIYLRKHYGVVGGGLARLIFVGGAGLRLTIFGLLNFVRPNGKSCAKVRLAIASLKYHLFGVFPQQ